jgi:hypothetical protein
LKKNKVGVIIQPDDNIYRKHKNVLLADGQTLLMEQLFHPSTVSLVLAKVLKKFN